ncbi:MAG TPA: hypothetical protein EYP62_08225 [Kiritimatiellae bacterium]|nr:hypothetical protein [Kiritimatiellia bacterium]
MQLGNSMMWTKFRTVGSAIAVSLALVTLPLTGCSQQEEAVAPPVPPQGAESFTSLLGRTAVPGPRVVATVDGVDITRAQLDREAETLSANLIRRMGPERVAQLRPQIRKQALESLIVQQLLKQAISNENIQVSDAEVSNRIAELTSTMPPGVTLQQQLARFNVTSQELADAIRFDLAVARLMEKHSPTNLAPSEAEIEKFYQENKPRFSRPETVRARHILIQVTPADPPELMEQKRKKAEELRQQLLQGADFAELAKKYSDCPSRTRGGELGMIARKQTVPAFEEAAFSQKIGEIGPVVETRFGYHIIQVTDHQPAREMPLEEVHDAIRASLTQSKQRQAASDYIEQLRSAAAIQYSQDAEQP